MAVICLVTRKRNTLLEFCNALPIPRGLILTYYGMSNCTHQFGLGLNVKVLVLACGQLVLDAISVTVSFKKMYIEI